MASTSSEADKTNQVFKGRGGTNNDGKPYEWSLLAFYGVLLLKPHIDDAWIASEPDECGDFDDVIIYWKESNAEEMFLVQCKHSATKKTIERKHFLHSGKIKNYFLEKYINSYNKKICSCFSNSNSFVGDTMRRLADNIKCILFTNNDVAAADILEQTTCQSLSFLNTEGTVNKFKTEKLGRVIAKTTLDQLTEKLYDRISGLKLNQILLLKNLDKKASKIKMSKIISKEKLNQITLKVLSKILFGQTYLKEQLKATIVEELNNVISKSTLRMIICQDKLNEIILKENLENLEQVDKKLNKFFSKDQLNEIISQDFEINYEFIDEKLFLFTNQIHYDKVHNAIVQQLFKIPALGNISDLDFNPVVRKYMLFISEWAQRKLDGSYALTRTHIIKKLTELMLEPYTGQFYRQNQDAATVSLSSDVNRWHSIIQDKDIILLNTSHGGSDSITRFLYRYLNNEVLKYNLSRFFEDNWREKFTDDVVFKEEMLRTVDRNENISPSHIYKVLWKCKGTPLVLEIDSSQDYRNILHIIELSNYKLKVIIMNNNRVDLPIMHRIPQPFQNLSNLKGRSEQLALEGMLNLQGRPVQLGTLIRKYDRLTNLVTVGDIIQTFTGDFNIGNALNKVPQYFIKRSITPTFLDIHLIVRALEHSDDVYVISGVNKSTLYRYLEKLQLQVDESNIGDYDQVVHQPNQTLQKYKIIANENQFINSKQITQIQAQNIHYLILHNTSSLQWIRTSGSTANIRPFRLATESNYTIAHLNIVSQLMYLKNQITVISGSPGLGKSTMMNHIARNTTTNMWVLQVNLSEHTTYYRSQKFKQAQHKDPAKHLYYFNNYILNNHKCNNTLNGETFTQFLNSNSLLILLDSFDEISPNFKEEVTAMIRALLTKGYRLLVSTRPVLKKFIEREFDVIAVTLNPFTADDQINFLTGYFKTVINNSTYSETTLQTFIEKLLQLAKKNLNDWEQEFTGVPLQTKLLAEVFKEDCDNYLKDESYSLQENFDLLYLYETFTERKIDILDKKFKGHIDYKSFEKYQQIYALKVLFRDDDLEGLEIDRQIANLSSAIEHAMESLQKDGIMVAKDEANITFVHRTFAEYFAAKWLFENMGKAKAEHLTKIIFKPDYVVTRNIFDRLLARDCPLHATIINQQVGKARTLIQENPQLLNVRDKGGRLPIHLAAAWGIRHPMPKQGDVMDCNFNKIETTSNALEEFLGELCHGKEELPTDKILRYSPIDYAVASDSLSCLNTIISNINFSPSISLGKNNIKDYIYYSSRYGYKSLIRRILQKFDVRQLPQYFNEPLDKISNRTALHWTSVNGDKDVVQLFFSDEIHRSDLNKLFLSKTDVYGKTALHLAVENSNCEVTSLLISYGADTEAKEKDGKSALHLAAQNGNNDTLRLLLQYKMDVNALDKNNNTPLHLVAFEGKEDAVSLLLKWKASTDLQNKDGRTVLHMATIKECVNAMRILLNHNPKIIDARDRDGNTAIHLSAKHGYQTALELLLSKNADQDIKNNEGHTALHSAAASGHTNIILLLSHTNINTKDGQGNTPLHLAASHNYGAVVSELLQSKPDINEENNRGRTALHEAVKSNCETTATILLERGANFSAKDGDGKTVLHLASMSNNCNIIPLLLQRGMDINEKDREGRTPLHLAAMEGQTRMVTVLISNKVDVAATDTNQSNALHLAVVNGHKDIIDILLQNGININAKNNDNKTVLHLASENGQSGIVELLLENGADTTITDADNYTAMNLADILGHRDVAAIFYSKGVEVFI